MEKVYTFGSDAAVTALLADLPERYEMFLNRSDMRWLVRILVFTWEQGSDAEREEAGNMLSGVAATLGHEWV